MKKTLILLLSLYSLCLTAQNNSNAINQLAEQFQDVAKNNASDLVYIQTSKGIYETEEDLWFKAYVLDAQLFFPSNRDKILFIQLTEDRTDQVVWEKKYEIENGFVNGHLFLKNDLPEGNYTLAAYSSSSFTKEVKEFYALKKIIVVKNISTKTTVTPVENDTIVQFNTFPEGGKLVSGIPSNLAFKAVNSKGVPVNILGTLFENNLPLVSFKSLYAGMGSFEFTPDASKKYYIEFLEPKSISCKKQDIATIAKSGKTLSLLSNTNEYVLFKIAQTNDLKEERIYLRLQIRGVVYKIATGILKNELTIKIPLDEVPQGIAEVTLFSENTLPVAERLVYIKQDQKLTIKTELNKKEFATREKASLKIKVTDEKEQPAVAHLGLSIYDGIYQNKLDNKNIQSHFLLSTQLKGNIYNPANYFNEQNKDRKQDLDLLLLTQGWRNYVWNEANLKENDTISPILFDEINGNVQLAKSEKTVTKNSPQKAIIVFSADESKEKELIIPDISGSFSISPKSLKIGEGGYTYIKLMTQENPKYQIVIKDNSFDIINNERKTKTLIYPITEIEKTNPKEISPFIERPYINKLNEVVITSKKKGPAFRDKYIGKLDSLAKLNADFVCRFNVLNCPNHRNEFDNKKPVEGAIYKISSGPNTEVVSTTVYHYPNYTEAQLLEMFNIATLQGYYSKKQFYEAVYDEVTILDSSPDYRNTLFWKPDIITDEKGEATVDFFCSDINSLFMGNIEGVSGNGLLGTQNFEFKVKKNLN